MSEKVINLIPYQGGVIEDVDNLQEKVNTLSSALKYQDVSIHFGTTTSAAWVSGSVNLTIPDGYTPLCVICETLHDYAGLAVMPRIENSVLYVSGYYNLGYASTDLSFRVWYIRSTLLS